MALQTDTTAFLLSEQALMSLVAVLFQTGIDTIQNGNHTAKLGVVASFRNHNTNYAQTPATPL